VSIGVYRSAKFSVEVKEGIPNYLKCGAMVGPLPEGMFGNSKTMIFFHQLAVLSFVQVQHNTSYCELRK